MNKGCIISLGLVLLLLTAGLGAYFMSGGEEDDGKIETTKATIGDIAQKAVATGAVKPRKEVVIKPLGKMLQGTPGMSGATLTGDGRIALILDVPSMLDHYAKRSLIAA